MAESVIKSQSSGDYNRWDETEVARLIETGRIDTETIRTLLIFDCHSSTLAHEFFVDRLDNQNLFEVLLTLAIEDSSGDAQLTASCWISQFPPEMLLPHIEELIQIANNEWDCVAVHAQRVLKALRHIT